MFSAVGRWVRVRGGERAAEPDGTPQAAQRLWTAMHLLPDRPVMVDECPMAMEWPAHDRDRRTCPLGPDECELAPADGEAAVRPGAPAAGSPDQSMDAAPG